MRARCFWGLIFVSQKSVVTQKHFLPIFQFKTNACVTSSFFSRASREARLPALSLPLCFVFCTLFVQMGLCFSVRLCDCASVCLCN